MNVTLCYRKKHVLTKKTSVIQEQRHFHDVYKKDSTMICT